MKKEEKELKTFLFYVNESIKQKKGFGWKKDNNEIIKNLYILNSNFI